MINVTPLLRPYFIRRLRQVRTWADDTATVQRSQLRSLLCRGERTLWGERYAFDRIKSYEEYADTVPAVSYPDIRPEVMRMVAGERNILWPGRCRNFAQSSGTSDGKSKYIPVTDDSLRLNHYRGAADAVVHYLASNPSSRLFAGKSFILGGSFANELTDVPRNVCVGDLSANLIDRINPLVNLLRIPSKRVALMADWHKKLPALVEASLHADITNISGVPSWFMTVLQNVIDAAGAHTIHDVWPHLEVFFHGGISFAPYRAQYERLTDSRLMHYVETYNASEGFFAVQDDPDVPAMLLLLDTGVFYEFIPMGAPGFDCDEADDRDSAHPAALPAWRLEPEHTYAMLITAPNGLWRYRIGDTVKIHSVNPLRITIAGRTKHYINAFGEELMVHNADDALTAACEATGASVADYTAAPVWAGDHKRGRHQWLVEWSVPPQCGTEQFAEILDLALQHVNSDYQAKRTGNIFLDRLSLTPLPAGTFDRWLESTGKLGGQRKVPRLCNDRHVVDAVLAIIGNHT